MHHALRGAAETGPNPSLTVSPQGQITPAKAWTRRVLKEKDHSMTGAWKRWRAGDEETENYTYAIALQNDT